MCLGIRAVELDEGSAHIIILK